MTNTTPAITVDVVVLTIRDDALQVLLVRRGVPPHQGRWALPGGFVLPDETLEGAAVRELEEETGLTSAVHLEQLQTYGAPRRDPRGRVVSVAYVAAIPRLPDAVPGTDAARARYRPVHDLPRLAFDHAQILADGIERVRSKIEYTSLAAAFCSDEFTVAELRRVYETIWGEQIDARNFHRKVTGAGGFLQPTGQVTGREGGRPAALFRRGPAPLLHPPLLRAGR